MNYLYFNKKKERIKGKNTKIEENIKILDTGSQGNSVLIKKINLLIDLGLTKKKLLEIDKDIFLKTNYVLITHEHGDHLNPSTLLWALKQYPHIKVLISEETYNFITSEKYKCTYKKKTNENGNIIYEKKENGEIIKNKPVYKLDENGNKIIEKIPYQKKILDMKNRFLIFDSSIKIKGSKVTPIKVNHGNIKNISVIIESEKNFKILYSTDLDSLEELPQKEEIFDICFLEANYDENELNKFIEELDPNDYSGLARAKSNLRHISEQEAIMYAEKTLKNNGIFIPMHSSSTFGTLKNRSYEK